MKNKTNIDLRAGQGTRAVLGFAQAVIAATPLFAGTDPGAASGAAFFEECLSLPGYLARRHGLVNPGHGVKVYDDLIEQGMVGGVADAAEALGRWVDERDRVEIASRVPTVKSLFTEANAALEAALPLLAELGSAHYAQLARNIEQKLAEIAAGERMAQLIDDTALLAAIRPASGTCPSSANLYWCVDRLLERTPARGTRLLESRGAAGGRAFRAWLDQSRPKAERLAALRQLFEI